MDGVDNLWKSLLALLFYSSASFWEKVTAASLFVDTVIKETFTLFMYIADIPGK